MAMETADVAKVAAKEGCTFLLAYVKQRLGDPPVSEVAKCMEEFFGDKLARERGESMSAYVARFERLYSRLTEALQGVSASGPKIEAGWLPTQVRGWLLLSRSGLADANRRPPSPAAPTPTSSTRWRRRCACSGRSSG